MPLLPIGFQKAVDASQRLPFLLIHRAGPVPIVFSFPLNPQTEDVTFRSRGQIVQTLEDAILYDFSGPRALLPRTMLRGTFGYEAKAGGLGIPMLGSAHTRTLEGIYETFNALNRELKKRLNAVQEYVNLGRLHFWRVWVDSFRVRRDAEQPLLYHYELTLVRLQDYLSPGGPSLPAGLTSGATALLSDFAGL